jgi:hypothetical protein
MIYLLEDTSKVQALFEGWEETLIYSCLQNVMGQIYVTDLDSPKAAMAYVGCFVFFAGKPDRELVTANPDGFKIMVPHSREWEALIEECFGNARKVTRYAIRKDTRFDRDYLEDIVKRLPEGYELCEIDSEFYDLCLENPATIDFVSAFQSKEKYLAIGRGMAILKDGRVVAGASSFSRYKEGIEIEVDTLKEERRKGLALVSCAALILKCLDEGLYPSWDAQNMNSVRLAEKLGYEFAYEYSAYEVE